jgi:acetyl-CoA carboxylase biotin carboxylase subunit
MIVRRLLIANRGEIAVRVIRTCRRLGITPILAASSADLDSVAARLAHEVVCLGPPRSLDSYLNIDAVVAAAVRVRADAVHPGYGFLAENPRLAAACEAAGIAFVGPTPAQLAALGDKLNARRHAVAAGLPVVPGGEADDLESARTLAAAIGYPVLIKAVAGGGGRGMRHAHTDAELEQSLPRAMEEAAAAFGDGRIYLERFVTAGRHIEVQLLGDGATVIHLGTRDCSIQRRYQKLLEEAPAPGLAEDLRAGMEAAAIALGRHLGYRGLGTVEFLFDCEGGRFYFLEMNARIQVEHPVTEAICGRDLVEEQLAVAEGRRLRLSQDAVRLAGHAIECRLNAEDWLDGFRPSPGRVTCARFAAGEGIRLDGHVQADSQIPPYYDSLLAKLIVHGPDRPAALARMAGALERCEIGGVANTLPMHRALLAHPAFAAGGVTTGFFERFMAEQA